MIYRSILHKGEYMEIRNKVACITGASKGIDNLPGICRDKLF